MYSNDFVFSMPVRCDRESCPFVWHMWDYTYRDGQWQIECDMVRSRVSVSRPSDEEVADAWRDYTLSALATGTDPLRQFGRPRRWHGPAN